MSRPPTCRRPPSSKPKGRALCSEAHTLGRSVLGSLSTFSMAVSVSKPPTTLQQGNGAPENVPGTSTPEREAPLQTGAQTVSRWAGCQHRLTGPNHTHVCRGLGAKGEHRVLDKRWRDRTWPSFELWDCKGRACGGQVLGLRVTPATCAQTGQGGTGLAWGRRPPTPNTDPAQSLTARRWCASCPGKHRSGR